MNAPVVASLIALVGALLGAVIGSAWTNGGRFAMQRRVIQQELNILEDLPPGPLSRALGKVVEGRIAAYVDRMHPWPDRLFREQRNQRRAAAWLFFVAALLLFAVGTWVIHGADHRATAYTWGVLALTASGWAAGSASAISRRDEKVRKRWKVWNGALERLVMREREQTGLGHRPPSRY